MTKFPVAIPDLGGVDSVQVIEVHIKPGDKVAKDQTLVVLESDKASMEIPSLMEGVVERVLVKVGDSVKEGDCIAELVVASSSDIKSSPGVEKSIASAPAPAPQVAILPVPAAVPLKQVVAMPLLPPITPSGSVHAGPAVRKVAREFGIDLAKVTPTGPRGRILKEDVQAYVRALAEKAERGSLPAIPVIDFSKFGEVDLQPLSKIAKLTVENMQRSWLNIPHVTEIDDVDITALELRRESLKPEMIERGIKLSPLPFIIHAVAQALREHTKLGGSLHSDGKHYVYKKYIHIGLAVDTPNGLLVPVIRDADTKDIWQLGKEIIDLSQRARDGKLKPGEMQGACFTVTSLGALGGLGFTPIINPPEVAILGISRMDTKPRWDGKSFVPAKMLPLCLSYDHRAVNGAEAGRFLQAISDGLLQAATVLRP